MTQEAPGNHSARRYLNGRWPRRFSRPHRDRGT